ncbi:MAG: hypothetical protein NVS9B3_13290 [Gemmatimonadaceae bacterium]
MMRLSAGGTGMADLHPTRVQTGYLVNARDVLLPMPCGSGVLLERAALGISWPAIAHIALAHVDADHVSDLATLLIARRRGPRPPRKAPVDLVVPVGASALHALSPRRSGRRYGHPA